VPYQLNWTPGELGTTVTHSAVEIEFIDQSNPLSPYHLFRDLCEFVHFDSGHNHVAQVRLEREADGTIYAMFKMLGVTGFFSWLVNGREVPVRVWCNPNSFTVTGDTAGRHMLIGQRRWSVDAIAAAAKRIRTEAYERPRTFSNRVGMTLSGRHKQLEVWRAYFENIRDFIGHNPLDSTITASSPQEVSGNPWKPLGPDQYPGCP
jgi:hypothetical protein